MTVAADPLARGWCPGILRPMESGDGLLARLHPPHGVLSPEQALAVSEASRACGNGVLDITGHANLQIRGVREATRAELETRLRRVGLVEPSPHAPFRVTVISPFADLVSDGGPDGRALADIVEAAARKVELPAKFLVAVDCDDRFPLDHLAPDLRVRADATGRLFIGLARQDGVVWGAPVSPAAFEETIGARLERLGRLLRANNVRRVRLLPHTELEPFVDQGQPGPATRSGIPPRAGLLRLGPDRFAAIAAAPFGQITADMLAAAADVARTAGLTELRLAPNRGLVLAPLAPEKAATTLAGLAACGLVSDPSDPRLRIVTCPGAPACASGQAATHDLAGRLAGHLPDRPWPASVHLSGCRKGCVRRGPSDLTLVAGETGVHVIPDGGPFDAPVAQADFDVIVQHLESAESAADFAHHITGGRAPRCATTT